MIIYKLLVKKLNVSENGNLNKYVIIHFKLDMKNTNYPKNKFRIFDIVKIPVENNKILVSSRRSKTSKLLTPSELQLLLGCQRFDTVHMHAVHYCQKRKLEQLNGRKGLTSKLFRLLLRFVEKESLELTVRRNEIEPIHQLLQQFVNDGFLISEHDLHEEIREIASNCEIYSESLGNLRIVGVPTRNRRKLLVRCLQSYLKKLKWRTKRCTFHIVDDSDEEVDQNRRTIEEILQQYETNYLWVGKSSRRKFAHAIAKAGNLPEEVIRFAVLGDSRCSIRTGACRNTLLLLAVGEPSIQVDDDTICRITPTPVLRDNLALSSKSDCQQYWYYDHTNNATVEESNIENDFLSLHEIYLGKHPSTLIQQYPNVNIDRLEKRLFEQLNNANARIAVTFMGALGDSGMFRHWQRLCFEGYSLQRLVNDKSKYKDYLSTRQIFRGVSQATIGDGPFCMAMHVGLDTRRLLPPFMPVQRNQDGIFGRLLHLCFKKACRGYIPYAIHHDPPERSTHIDLSDVLSVGPLRTPDVLEALLWSIYKWPFGLNPIHNMEVVGHYMSDLSQCKQQYFKMCVWEHCRQLTRHRIKYLQRSIEERNNAPDYWHRDAQQVLNNFHELLNNKEICIPSDLPGTPKERLGLFQELVGKFGRLLIHWPAIWETAKEMRERGEFKSIVSKTC